MQRFKRGSLFFLQTQDLRQRQGKANWTRRSICS